MKCRRRPEVKKYIRWDFLSKSAIVCIDSYLSTSSSNESCIAISLSDLSTEMTPNFQYLDVFSYFFYVIEHKYKIAVWWVMKPKPWRVLCSKKSRLNLFMFFP